MSSPNGPPGGGPSSTHPAPAGAEQEPVPAAGDRAPAFTLTDQHGQSVSLEDFRGRQAVLLVFYPFAFSRVCGSELQAIHESVGDFQNERIQVLAASCDALYSLRAYADEAGFGFPLLADHWPHGGAARAYGVFDAERGCAVRGTFLIDQEGVVRWTVVNGLADARSLDDYRTALTAAGV
jgi:peroxiredoxin